MQWTWPATPDGSLNVVHWLIQTSADVTPHDEWLAPAERETLAALRYSKRRRDWRLGRWTAKQALAHRLALSGSVVGSLSDLVVSTGANGAPSWSLYGRAAPWPISISHSHDRGLCAIGPPGSTVGCDLECVEPRIDAFVHDWFTPSEQDAVARAGADERHRFVTLVWSAKESSLKAIGTGLTISTHRVTVSVEEPTVDRGWNPFLVTRADDRQPMHGWWAIDAGDLITIVATPALGAPVALSGAHVLTREAVGVPGGLGVRPR